MKRVEKKMGKDKGKGVGRGERMRRKGGGKRDMKSGGKNG